MRSSTPLACACGQVRLEACGDPIIVAECHCSSCRTAGLRLQALPTAPMLLEENGGTSFVLYRKDRVRIDQGPERLKAFRLSPSSPTRRLVASCCGTTVCLDFERGHWLSLYARLWPDGDRPKPELRTMTSDLTEPTALPNDIPNSRTQSLSFFGKLLRAWAAMGFRSPKIAVARELHV